MCKNHNSNSFNILTMTKFNIISDLHLEMTKDRITGYQQFKFPCTAENLIIAGDFGRTCDKGYSETIERASSCYKTVIFILGNHEFYGSNWEQSIGTARDIAKKLSNVYFLYNDSFKFENEKGEIITIVGSTLHSHIPPLAQKEVSVCLNDFRSIRDWNVEKHNTEHQVSIDFLKKVCHEQARKGNKLIGLFHHAPFLCDSSHPNHKEGRALTTAFATDLTEHEWFGQLNTLIFGHTHYNGANGKVVAGVQIITNQAGYNKEKLVGYDAKKVFEF